MWYGGKEPVHRLQRAVGRRCEVIEFKLFSIGVLMQIVIVYTSPVFTVITCGGYIPTNSVEVIWTCMFVIQIYTLILYKE